MPATGVAGGIERLLLAAEAAGKLPDLKQKPKVQVVYVNETLLPKAIEILQKVREYVSADTDLTKRSFSNQLKYANSRGVPYVIIIGEKELSSGKVKLRNMKTGKEELIRIADSEKIADIADQLNI